MVNMSALLEFGSVAYRVCASHRAPAFKTSSCHLIKEPNRDQAGTVQGIECSSNSHISITDECAERKNEIMEGDGVYRRQRKRRRRQ